MYSIYPLEFVFILNIYKKQKANQIMLENLPFIFHNLYNCISNSIPVQKPLFWTFLKQIDV